MLQDATERLREEQAGLAAKLSGTADDAALLAAALEGKSITGILFGGLL
jgi:hypothetical protein